MGRSVRIYGANIPSGAGGAAGRSIANAAAHHKAKKHAKMKKKLGGTSATYEAALRAAGLK